MIQISKFRLGGLSPSVERMAVASGISPTQACLQLIRDGLGWASSRAVVSAGVGGAMRCLEAGDAQGALEHLRAVSELVTIGESPNSTKAPHGQRLHRYLESDSGSGQLEEA